MEHPDTAEASESAAAAPLPEEEAFLPNLYEEEDQSSPQRSGYYNGLQIWMMVLLGKVAVLILFVLSALLLSLHSGASDLSLGLALMGISVGSAVLLASLWNKAGSAPEDIDPLSFSSAQVALGQLAWTGFTLLVVNLAASGSSWINYNAMAGMGVFTTASGALMVSFWRAEKTLIPPRTSAYSPHATVLVDISSAPGDEEGLHEALEEVDANERGPGYPVPDSTPTSRLRGTRRLLQLAQPQMLYVYVGCAVLLCRLPFSLCIPHYVATTLGALAHQEWARAQSSILAIVVVGTVDALLDFWCVFLFGYATQRIVRDVRSNLFRQLLGQEVAFFDSHENPSGSLASRLSSDIVEMAADLTWFFRFSMESVVRISGITVYMMIRSPTLGSCALCMVPIVAAVNKVYGDWLARNALNVQNALSEANAVAQETLLNIRTVISFVGESHAQAKYRAKIDRHFHLSTRQVFLSGVYYMVISTFLINTIVQASLLAHSASSVDGRDLARLHVVPRAAAE
jgi:ABC-type multidrug transport system fused ATPase/permease subunit